MLATVRKILNFDSVLGLSIQLGLGLQFWVYGFVLRVWGFGFREGLGPFQ